MNNSKNLILAMVLCFLIFMGWHMLSVEMGWLPEEAPTNATQTQTPQEDTAAFSSSDPFAAQRTPAQLQARTVTELGETITVETPLYKAVFSSIGCTLLEFKLKKYYNKIGDDAQNIDMVTRETVAEAPLGLMVDGEQTWYLGTWVVEGDDLTLENGDSGILRFSTEYKGMSIIRELTFFADTYRIDETVSVSASVPKTIKLAFTYASPTLQTDRTVSLWDRLYFLVFGGEEPKYENSVHNPTRVSWQEDGSFNEEHNPSSMSGGGLIITDKPRWMAIMNNYFMGAVSMPGEHASAKASYANGVYHVAIGKTGVAVLPEKPAVEYCTYYLGPKESDLLRAAPNDLRYALDYGFFSIIAKPLVYLLQMLYDIVQNYGIAIILMTLVVKAVFWPLSQKSYRSMTQMKKLQPMIEKIKAKHDGDKAKINAEVMQLYKSYKINPASGCLPILIQIPVFFALYQALLNAIELRHAPFIPTIPFTDIAWLTDLSAIDPFFITPLVMGAAMFMQQKMTPPPADAMQAKLLLFMPVIFVVLFITFPAGLVLYWLTNSAVSMLQQWLTLRKG